MISTLTALLMNTRMASNAEFSWSNAANGILNGVRQAGNPNIGFTGVRQLHDNENNLMAQKTMAEINMEVANARQDSLKKQLKDDIRRSFSIYA